MRKKWGQMPKIMIALICACIFWVQGTEWKQDQSTAEQSIFHTYTKPSGAPDFSLENLQGKMVDIRSHRGQVIFLNFWATW